MRKPVRTGNILLSLLFSLLLNLEGLIPAVILFALHVFVRFPLWSSVVCAVLWVVSIAVQMAFFRFAAGCANEKDPPKENKNPYSAKNNG